MINKKRIWQSILVFVMFSFIVFALNFTSRSLNYDIAWCYHISQKVANGFDLYSEIGTVVTPIYFWIGSLFIKIFGNTMASMDLYAGVVSGLIATILFNIIQETHQKENKYMMLIFIYHMVIMLYVLALTNYNFCAIMWVLLAAFLEVRKERKLELKLPYFTKKKENIYNLAIGIVLGLAFFTKQNIGTYGVLATGIFSLVYKCFIKKENAIKEIFLKAGGFLIVLISFVGYFLIQGTFADFMNFCIGGLLEFGDKNLKFGIPYAFLGVIVILTISFGMISEKKENNTVWIAEIIYLLCMMLLIYPLTNQYHLLCGLLMLLPVSSILLDRLANKEGIYNIAVVLFLLFVLGITISNGGISTKTEILFEGEPTIMNHFAKAFIFGFLLAFAVLIIKQKENVVWDYIVIIGVLFCFTTIKVSSENFERNSYLPEKLSVYKNHGYPQEVLEYIDEVIEYILQKESEGETVYVVSADASYYMLALGRNQYKYDLTLYGSLGYKGEETLIEETKALGDVLLLKDENVMFQEPVAFDEFVKENYQPIDKVGNLIVYSTKE